jgi:hypothetical protein
MRPTTRTPTTYLRTINGTARQVVTVLSVGPVSAVCAVETIGPDGTLRPVRLTSIMRAAIPRQTLEKALQD